MTWSNFKYTVFNLFRAFRMSTKILYFFSPLSISIRLAGIKPFARRPFGVLGLEI